MGRGEVSEAPASSLAREKIGMESRVILYKDLEIMLGRYFGSY
jgi:hypothetical protein